MKAIIEKMLECLLAFLPFLSKRSKKKVEKMKEFSELVREQYGFLVGQLEKVLAKALTCRCMRENCDRRLAVDGTAAV